ncbi:MAG: hypothetical protein KR126chlam1_00709 [Chlamydiae bacterium]|nr:hypothetical protein [Chlamydiota bacterium]
MTRSMTAYSRVVSEEKRGLSWVVEIHSVNRRHLDLHIHLPKEFMCFDVDLRKEISKSLFRGNVTVKVFLRKEQKGSVSLSLLKSLKKEWEKIASDLGYSKESINLPFLLKELEQSSFDALGVGEKTIRAELKRTMEKALELLIQMKTKEGKALSIDLTKRLKSISAHLNKIEKLAGASVVKKKKKLLEVLASVLEESTEDERVLREVAIFAEKVDTSEELTRLHSHIVQMAALLEKAGQSKGKSLDFLTQEMLRETNTIASKAADLKITQLSLQIKGELEKIKEQVQNIE